MANHVSRRELASGYILEHIDSYGLYKPATNSI